MFLLAFVGLAFFEREVSVHGGPAFSANKPWDSDRISDLFPRRLPISSGSLVAFQCQQLEDVTAGLRIFDVMSRLNVLDLLLTSGKSISPWMKGTEGGESSWQKQGLQGLLEVEFTDYSGLPHALPCFVAAQANVSRIDIARKKESIVVLLSLRLLLFYGVFCRAVPQFLASSRERILHAGCLVTPSQVYIETNWWSSRTIPKGKGQYPLTKRAILASKESTTKP